MRACAPIEARAPSESGPFSFGLGRTTLAKRLDLWVSEPENPAPPARKPQRKSTPEQLAERRRLHETRVEYVADMMRELRYRTGVTNKSLAREWDLPSGYVAQVTTEASRRVRAEVVQDDNVLSTISLSLDRVLHEALDSGDRHAVIKACQVWAQVTGAGAATKVQVQTELTSMTPEQLQSRKAEIIARLTGKAPALEIVEISPEGE